MLAQRAVTLLLLLLFASEAGAEIYLVKAGSLSWPDTWPLLIFVGIGSATAILGRRLAATPLLCLLLSSMAAILSGVLDLSVFKQDMGRVAGTLLRFEWSALQLLFGFCFIHFALVFPIESHFLRKHSRLPGIIYAIYVVSFIGAQLGAETAAAFLFLSIFAGLLTGVVTLIRKYFLSLTPAEKNRLRVVLIGCLAGAIPAAIAVIAATSESGKDSRLEFGLFMLPFFPLGLVAAVLHENFSEISKWLQRTLIYSLAAAGSITCFFLCYLIAAQGGGSPIHPLIISAGLAVIAAFPLLRWSGSYISTCFCPADEAEPAPKPARMDFSPIEPNPYIVGNPIRSPEIFFGREEDFRFIRGKLQAEQQGCVIVLRGDRRTGKTSILYQILNGRLGADFIPVFIDMQGIVVENDAEMLLELAAKIREAARNWAPTNGNSAGMDSYPGFSFFMDGLMAAIGHRRLVLLMDEYELIESKVNGGKLSAEIFGYLDSLLIRHSRLSYVFTGSRALESTSAWNSLLTKSFYRDISFLARKDAQALICNPIQDRIQFTPNAVNGLLRLTNGHPFFTQALCQTLVDVVNDQRTAMVDGKCIDETLRRLLENAPPQLYYQWTTFSDPEKVVLSALAASLKESDKYLTAERLEKLLRSLPGEFPQKLNAPAIRMHFEQLREKSMLDRDQTRYRFTMDLMRRWVQHEHNVWKVLSEVGK